MKRVHQSIVYGWILVIIFAVLFFSRNATEGHRDFFTSIESKFNFTSEIIKTSQEGKTIQTLAIFPKEAGLLFDKGFRGGDIILSHTKIQFYTLLNGKRAGAVEVFNEAITPPDDNKTSRTIIFKKSQPES